MISFSNEHNEFSLENKGTEGEKTDVISLTIAQSNLICSDYISNKLIDVIKRQPLEYASPSAEIFDLVINKNKYNGVNLSYDNVIFGINVLSFVAHFVRVVAKRSEEIIILGPIYNKFREVIESNKRICVECRLDLNSHDIYTIDFIRLEELMMRAQVKALIICNPHNPTGNCWSERDLMKISELSQKYNIKVLSDEIHSDLYFKDSFKSYIHYDNEAIVVDSPTKAYNVPALKIAYAISSNVDSIKKIGKEITASGVGSPGLLELNMLKAAYDPKSVYWLSEFKEHCKYNLRYLQQTINSRMSKFQMNFPDSSYLAWINTGSPKILEAYLKIIYENKKILVSEGKLFSQFDEEHFRINCSVDKESFRNSCDVLVECYNILFQQK